MDLPKKDTAQTTSSSTPAEYNHFGMTMNLSTSQPRALTHAHLSWWSKQIFAPPPGLGIVGFKSANSCFVAMASSSAVDIESAPGFIPSIVPIYALLDEVSTQLSSSLMDSWGVMGGSRIKGCYGITNEDCGTILYLFLTPRLFYFARTCHSTRCQAENRTAQGSGKMKFLEQ